jgi:hypothetical protein
MPRAKFFVAWTMIAYELTPQHMLADLFDSDDFPGHVLNPEEAAKIAAQRLIDGGLDIKPWEPNR